MDDGGRYNAAAEIVTGCPSGGGLAAPRRAGMLSGSLETAVSVTGSPTLTVRFASATDKSGGLFVRNSSRREPKSPPTSVEITWGSI
jgi:hypothetical protein